MKVWVVERIEVYMKGDRKIVVVVVVGLGDQ